jgi:hypothetical protein
MYRDFTGIDILTESGIEVIQLWFYFSLIVLMYNKNKKGSQCLKANGK